MEKFQKSIEEAKKALKVADHLLLVTHPMVQDPRLLLIVVENTSKAMEYSMNSLLEHHKLFKRINVLPEAFEPRFQIFKSNVAPLHKIGPHYVELLKDLKDITIAHKESPVEFTRNDKFVICSDKYKMKTIGVPDMKLYIGKAKEFVDLMGGLVKENEGIFRRG